MSVSVDLDMKRKHHSRPRFGWRELCAALPHAAAHAACGAQRAYIHNCTTPIISEEAARSESSLFRSDTRELPNIDDEIAHHQFVIRFFLFLQLLPRHTHISTV